MSDKKLEKIGLDEMCKDEVAKHDKESIMKKSWYNSLFFSLSDSMKFMGSMLMTVGMAIVIPSVVTNINLGLGAAIAAAPVAGLGILGAASLCMAGGIAASFASSRFFHSSSIDQSEMNAQHNARYIVKELKKEMQQPQPEPQMQSFEQNARNDGKSWVAVTETSAQQTQHITLH